jgi:hypothetical protein
MSDRAGAVLRRPAIALTPEERERYQRWWIEDSGLTLRELQQIAVGLSPAD